MTSVINMLTIAATSAIVWYTGESLSRYSIAAKAFANDGVEAASGAERPLLLAKAAKKPAAKTGVREKTITREKVYRGESKKVDFEAIDIGGERKTTFGSIVNQNKASKEYDLIRVRLRWHDEMKQSTSSLENGRAGS